MYIYIYYIQDMINKALFNLKKTIVQRKCSWMFQMCHSRVTWDKWGPSPNRPNQVPV